MSATLTYTEPGEIDGEPDDVRELSLQQLGEALTQVSELTEKTITQLRSEGHGRVGDHWENTEDARAAGELIWRLRQAIGAERRLQEAV